jgi:low affinity Fe/Cu permease
MQIKLDELLRAVKGAETAMADLEDLTEDELDAFREHYAEVAAKARARMRHAGDLPFETGARTPSTKRKRPADRRPGGAEKG